MEELEQTIQMVKDRARVVVEAGIEHIMIFVILTPDRIALATPIMKEEHKDMFKPAITTMLHELRAYAYVMVDEAWQARISANSPLWKELQSGRKRVRDLPLDDRAETLIITAVENGKSYRSWYAIIRLTVNDERELGEWKEDAKGVPEGRMVVSRW